MADTDTAQRGATAQLFIDALLKPGDETAGALADSLTDDVTLMGMFGVAKGKDSLLPHLAAAPELAPGTDLAAFLAPVVWSGPLTPDEVTGPGDSDAKSPGLEDGYDVVFEADKSPRHFVFQFGFVDDGRIQRIAIGAWIEASEKLPVKIPDDLKEKIATASDRWRQVVVSYATGDGKMHIGLRGSAYVYSDDQIALWAREDGGSLGIALAEGTPHEIALLFFDPEVGAYYEFYGRGSAASSEEVRNDVYETMHEWEKNHSWDRQGVAVIVDVDRVRGTTMDGFIEMERQ
jgi:hypothetical protein